MIEVSLCLMSDILESTLPDYLRDDILLHPEKRQFAPFDLVRLLGTVFSPTHGCRVCILLDFDEPAELIKDFSFPVSYTHLTLPTIYSV